MAVDSRDVGARVRSRLLGPAGAGLDTLNPPERRLRVRDEVMAVLKEARMILPSRVVTQVVNQVSDEVVGLGPIERLLKDPEDSAISLDKWLASIWLIANAKNGISSHELGRSLGIQQKSAWFVLHRVRLAMQTQTFEKLSGKVEVDETFIGGRARNMHKSVHK